MYLLPFCRHSNIDKTDSEAINSSGKKTHNVSVFLMIKLHMIYGMSSAITLDSKIEEIEIRGGKQLFTTKHFKYSLNYKKCLLCFSCFFSSILHVSRLKRNLRRAIKMLDIRMSFCVVNDGHIPTTPTFIVV